MASDVAGIADAPPGALKCGRGLSGGTLVRATRSITAGMHAMHIILTSVSPSDDMTTLFPDAYSWLPHSVHGSFRGEMPIVAAPFSLSAREEDADSATVDPAMASGVAAPVNETEDGLTCSVRDAHESVADVVEAIGDAALIGD